MNLFSLTLILFLVIDPLGKVSSFERALEPVSPNRRTFVAIRELLIALIFMLFFNFLGENLFSLFQISEPTVRIGSGVILFIGALRILYPPAQKTVQDGQEEPLLVPLAIPFVASPALLTSIMLFAHLVPGFLTMTLAIFIAWTGALLILSKPHIVKKIIGENGLMACERLMGMILILLAIQRFMDGIYTFIITI